MNGFALAASAMVHLLVLWAMVRFADQDELGGDVPAQVAKIELEIVDVPKALLSELEPPTAPEVATVVEPKPPSPVEPTPPKQAQPEVPEPPVPKRRRSTHPAPAPLPVPEVPSSGGSKEPPAGAPGGGSGAADDGAVGSGPRRLETTLTNRGRGSAAGPAPARRRAASPPCRGEDRKPRAVKRVPIEYPRAARASRLQGELRLRAHVDRRGKVTRVEVLKSVGAAIDGPASKALALWQFEPAQRCGKRVEGRYTVRREFRLGD